MKRNCKSCGAEIKPGETVCPECNAPAPEETIDTESIKAEAPEMTDNNTSDAEITSEKPHKSQNIIVLISIISAVVVLAVVLTIILTTRSTMSSAINNYIHGYNGMIKSTYSAYDQLGKNVTVKAKIKSKSEIKKDSTDKTEQAVLNYLPENYQEAYTVNIEITLKGSKNSNTNSTQLYMCKVNGKWYVLA